jgi:hypothetical protein
MEKTTYTVTKFDIEDEKHSLTYYDIVKSCDIEDLAKVLVIKTWEDLGEYCLAGSSQEVYFSHDGDKYDKFEDAIQAEINWLNSIKR